MSNLFKNNCKLRKLLDYCCNLLGKNTKEVNNL